MKNIKPFRETKKQIKTKYILYLYQRDEDLIFPIPKKIVDALGIEVYDIAIFELEENKIIVNFVKKNLWSFVEEQGGTKNETGRSVKQIKKRKKQIS